MGHSSKNMDNDGSDRNVSYDSTAKKFQRRRILVNGLDYRFTLSPI